MNRVTDSELFGDDREEAQLRQFRSLLSDLVRILRHALGARTIALHWVNRQRGIFVPETHASSRADVVFRDRMPLEASFLDRWKDIQEPVWLKIGKDLQPEELTHYYDRASSVTGFVFLLPFVSNKETVALTVIECDQDAWNAAANESITAYMASIDHLLQTYLELSNLLEVQKSWITYDNAIDTMLRKREPVAVLAETVQLATEFLPGAACSLFLKAAGGWRTVLRHGNPAAFLALGTDINSPSVAADALATGAPAFGIHLNGSPKRATSRESSAMGATLALPFRSGEAVQALLLVNHADPLAFNDANRHQLVNLVRVAGQKMAQLSRGAKTDLLIAPNGLILSEFADAVIETELEHLRQSENSRQRFTWVGYVMPADYAQLRTRLSADDLRKVHHHIISSVSPAENGFAGLMVFHAEHIHMVILQGNDPADVDQWGRAVAQRIKQPVETSRESLSVQAHIAVVPLYAAHNDAYDVAGRARKALNQIARHGEPGLEISASDPLV